MMAVISLTENIRDFLLERIDPNNGLIDVLRRQSVLSIIEIENIQAKKTDTKRNMKLLNYIEKKHKVDELIKALREANQAHIANYMDANGEYQTEFGAVWPLEERELSTLNVNHGGLLDLISASDIVPMLYSLNVINKRQRDTISSKLTEHEKNEVLLRILERGSIEFYTKSIQCLHDSRQSHIANILSEGSVVLNLHTQLSGYGNSANIGDKEDRIATKISDFIQGELPEATHGTIQRILVEANLKLIAAKKGKSIVVYICCKMMEDLWNLEENLKSGDLKTWIEKLYSVLIPLPRETKVEIRLSETDIRNAKVFIRAYGYKEQLKTENLPALLSPNVRDLPLELMDIVIRKSFLHSRFKENEMKHLSDSDVINRLASVQFCWLQRIIDCRFKKTIWRHFSVIYRRNEKTAAIIRNNRTFLESRIRPKSFIKQLKSSNCLTDVQALIMNRKKSNTKQEHNYVSDLLNVMRLFDKSNHKAFGRCFHQIEQRDAAVVEINGGVVIKAEMTYSNAWRNKVWMGEKLNELMKKIRGTNPGVAENINRLEQEGLEILETTIDRGTVVWIWCQSQGALRYVHNAYESNRLTEVFTEYKMDSSSCTDSRPNISIDHDQLRKDVDLLTGTNFNTQYFRDFLPSDFCLMDDEDYRLAMKIQGKPHLEEEYINKFWNFTLKHIMQIIKIWNSNVLNPVNLAYLFRPIKHHLDISIGTQAFPPVSRLDLVAYIINEADCFVREEVVKMLAKFNLAIPLVIPDIHERNQFLVILPMLKSIVIKLKSTEAKTMHSLWRLEHEYILKNFLFSSPFKMVVALRLGTNHIGKSTILNQLMKKKFMFSSRKEPGAECGPPRTLDGTVEIVVLTQGTCSDTVWVDLSSDHYEKDMGEVAILANLHGNALSHVNTLKYLEGLGSSFIVFRMPDAREDQWKELVSKFITEERLSCIFVDQNNEGHCIQTNLLMNYETQNTVRKQIIQSLKFSNGQQRSAVERPLKYIETFNCPEAKQVVNVVKTHGVSKLKELIIKVIDTKGDWSENPIILSLIDSLFKLFHFPKKQLRKSMIYLERKLNKLSDEELVEVQRMHESMREDEKKLTKEYEHANAALRHPEKVKLRLEHFYRLVGEIYSRNEKHMISQVAMELIPDRCADLLLNGHVIELVDGDLGQIQFPWIKAIFERLFQKRPNLKIFVISVIGLQSSGKSTLLNALFGCRFRVGAGRCTVGFLMRMLFLEKDLAEKLKCDAFVVIDTEGFCSSEKINDPSSNYNDRKMATFAMAISNLTIVNILGEVVTEMVEILQVAIIAMTRFNEVDIKPDIIVVQHLHERNAEMNKRANIRFSKTINKTFQLLKENNAELVTNSSECVSELKKKLENKEEYFHQFGPFKDGASLNSTPSEGYHKDVVKLFESLLKITSLKSIHIFEYWSKNLFEACWKSVQEENFAFIFKNVKEIADFLYFEKQISRIKEQLETAFRFHRDRFTMRVNDSIKEFISSEENTKGNLDSLRSKLTTEFKGELKKIPNSCIECEKCGYFMRKRNLFLDECIGRKIQSDARKSINEYISRLHNTSLEISKQIFESSAIRQGCYGEFYEIIDEEMEKQYLTTTAAYRKDNQKEIVEQIWHILKSKATEKEAECCSADLSSRFKEALENHYVKTGLFKDICKKIQTEITLEYLCGKRNKSNLGGSLHIKSRSDYPFEDIQLQFICRELDYFVRQIIESRQPDLATNGINFDEGLISTLKFEFPDIIKGMESHYETTFSDNFKQKLLLYTLQQLRRKLEPLQMIWDKMNKPSQSLESQKERFIKLIETKLCGETDDASLVVAETLLETCKQKSMREIHYAKIRAFKDIPWTRDIQKIRARYFIYLAEQVKVGLKSEAINHFLNPDESIKDWFKTEVDSSNKVKFAENRYPWEIKRMLHELKDAIRR